MLHHANRNSVTVQCFNFHIFSFIFAESIQQKWNDICTMDSQSSCFVFIVPPFSSCSHFTTLCWLLDVQRRKGMRNCSSCRLHFRPSNNKTSTVCTSSGYLVVFCHSDVEGSYGGRVSLTEADLMLPPSSCLQQHSTSFQSLNTFLFGFCFYDCGVEWHYRSNLFSCLILEIK